MCPLDTLFKILINNDSIEIKKKKRMNRYSDHIF